MEKPLLSPCIWTSCCDSPGGKTPPLLVSSMPILHPCPWRESFLKSFLHLFLHLKPCSFFLCLVFGDQTIAFPGLHDNLHVTWMWRTHPLGCLGALVRWLPSNQADHWCLLQTWGHRAWLTIPMWLIFFTDLSCGSLSPWTLSPDRSWKRQKKLPKDKKTEGGESLFGTETDTVLRS